MCDPSIRNKLGTMCLYCCRCFVLTSDVRAHLAQSASSSCAKHCAAPITQLPIRARVRTFDVAKRNRSRRAQSRTFASTNAARLRKPFKAVPGGALFGCRGMHPHRLAARRTRMEDRTHTLLCICIHTAYRSIDVHKHTAAHTVTYWSLTE